MRALLLGLISGFFFTACAPVHWGGGRLLLLGGMGVAVLLLILAVRRRAQPGPLEGAVLAMLTCVGGGLLSSAWLALHLHSWQYPASGLTAIEHKSDCLTITRSQLMRLEVVGLPSRTLDGSRFDARVLALQPGCARQLGQRLRVSWKAAKWPVAGTQILAQVRVRAVRGSVSPGAFDHELHLARRGIRYSAYLVRTLSVLAPANSGAGKVARVRLRLRQVLAGMPLEYPGVLLALLTGDSSLLAVEDWDLLQATGTVHLLVISGLHVGLVAAGLLVFIRGWRRMLLFWPLAKPALGRWVEALAVVLLLSGYVVFAGAGIAAVRALVMLSVVIFAWSLGRNLLASGLLALVVGAVGLSDAGAALAPGFWLSFGLVAWLVLRDVPTRWSLGRELLTLHVGCSLVLVPMLAWLGLPVAVVSPVANLVSVPVVTLVLVPLVLLGGALLFLSPSVGELMFGLADQVVVALFRMLSWMASAIPGSDLPVLSGAGYLALGVVLLALLLPAPGWLRLWLGFFLALLLGHVLVTSPGSGGERLVLPTARQANSEEGEFTVQVLDVGQGLAVVVTTLNQVLLYDTGARFPSGFNYADAVIVPALKAHGRRKLDVLMISHHDLDHAGSLAQLVIQFAPQRLIGTARQGACTSAGDASWRVDGVSFEVLQQPGAATRNNASCVLVIRGREATAVLAGDIEASAEQALLEQLPENTDLLVVPHHGSRTSSTQAFVDRLRPGLALVSAGRDNRFGHPHPQVVARYRGVGSCVLNTARQGTLEWRSGRSQRRVRAARQARRQRWQLGAPLLWSKNPGQVSSCLIM